MTIQRTMEIGCACLLALAASVSAGDQGAPNGRPPPRGQNGPEGPQGQQGQRPPPPPPSTDEFFKRFDTNQDGEVTLDEFLQNFGPNGKGGNDRRQAPRRGKEPQGQQGQQGQQGH